MCRDDTETERQIARKKQMCRDEMVFLCSANFQVGRERDRERQRETERDRERQRETKRDTERERESER